MFTQRWHYLLAWWGVLIIAVILWGLTWILL